MTEQLDFLTPSTPQIRHQLKNIVDSYNHDWDLLAELTQNAVDAITLAKPTGGHLTLEIDACDKRIALKDNGCGISPTELPELLAPFSTGKLGNENLIGHKGVGISFVIFSSAEFEIESHHPSGSSRASISGAWAWLDSQTDHLPKLSFAPITAQESTGTKVTLMLPSEVDHDFFKYSYDQLSMILLTRTAIGDVRTVWGEPPNKSISLTFKNLDGETRSEHMDCSYLLPISRLSSSQHISVREFQDWNTGDRTDSEKRQKLKDKLIYLDAQKERGGRRIRYWSCFVPQRKAWDIVSVNSDLVDREILELNPLQRMDQFGDADYLFSGGMYTSTRGMPTGIRSELRAKGSAGYLPNFFIILDDPQLSFDIGRKSIPGRQLGMLRDVASDVFRDLINVVRRHLTGEPDVEPDGWNRSAVFNEIRDMPDLESPETKFLKRPSSQEATVAAMFFEMIGSKVIENIRPYVAGYKNKYDLYAKHGQSDVVVEFKYALTALFRDFDDEAKLFDEIDIVVVWEVTERDHEVISSRGVNLHRIEQGLTGGEDSLFHYRLSLGIVRPIKVICLKDLMS